MNDFYIDCEIDFENDLGVHYGLLIEYAWDYFASFEYEEEKIRI